MGLAAPASCGTTRCRVCFLHVLKSCSASWYIYFHFLEGGIALKGHVEHMVLNVYHPHEVYHGLQLV